MSARGRNPVRKARRDTPAPDSTEPERQPADAGQPASGFVALPGLAVAAAGGQPQNIRTGLQALAVRPKLKVGRADDQAEVEADAMADAVVHQLLQAGSREPGRQPEGEFRGLRRAPASAPAPADGPVLGAAGGEVGSDTEQALKAASSSGTPLAPALRREYEDAFGADLGAVRVHSGPASARLNTALGARAFTLGSDIYFGGRVPDAAGAADRHLMAHELAHTLQDGGTAHRAVLRRLAIQITPSWVEADAEMTLETTSAEAHPHTGMSDEPTHESDMLVETVGTVEGAGLPAAVTAEARHGELFIEEVAIVGRPTTLYSGSMGDHMTAFVISRKGVENAIVGQSFTDAVRELDALADELKKLPGWGLADALKPVEGEDAEIGVVDLEATTPVESEAASAMPSSATLTTGTALETGTALATAVAMETGTDELGLDEEAKAPTGRYQRATHHARLLEAQDNLALCRGLLDTAGPDDLKLVRLQDYIAAYLELRELVPLSASNWKGANRGRGGKGDGETGLEGFLADPDENPQPPGQLRRDFLSTIATYRMAQAAVEPNKQALAILMPGLDHALSADARTTLMARQHVQSVLSNFPQNFAGLAEDILLAEGRAREKAQAKAKAAAKSAKAEVKKSKKRKGPAKSEEPVTPVEEEVAEPVERTEDENFAIILNHLTRLVRMRYAEAARAELTHQHKTIEQHPEDEVGEAAVKDAQALTTFLTKRPPVISSSAAEDLDDVRGSKRSRGSESDVVDDDVYGSLSAQEAKLVYTGRDIYKATKSAGAQPKADLAVQIVLDDAGAVGKAVVERQGKYTKGAHTLPWIQWLTWLNADIKGKQPAEALAVFQSTTVPGIKKWLSAPTVAPELGLPSTGLLETGPSEMVMIEDTVVAEESKEGEADVLPTGSMPLIELQAAIADMLDDITNDPDSSVLDATDTGGKGEAHYRTELLAYEKGERMTAPEELVRYILALCDVGEAETELAERIIDKVLLAAKQDYPNAYAASKISAYDFRDLVDRASNGKAGVYEPDAEPDDGSDSDSEEVERKKKKQKKSHGKGRGTGKGGGTGKGSGTDEDR